MMNKLTSTEIFKLVWDCVRESPLASAVSVMYADHYPNNPAGEFVVVTSLSNVMEEVQVATVNVNIYVPDSTPTIEHEEQRYPNRDRRVLFNDALNHTLSRTIMTSGTTLLVLLCILFLGGDSVRSFSFAMILGVIFGTLSSIFLAAPIAFLTLSKRERKESKEVAMA